MNEPRSPDHQPHPDKNKSGDWRFVLPDGEKIQFSGPSGGRWTVVRGGTKYLFVLSFTWQGVPIVVCKRRITPAPAYKMPTKEQEGLTCAIWVDCKSKEEV